MIHTVQIRVYYKDTDAGGVVYHTRYGEFLEIARSEMLRELGLSAKEVMDKYNLIFPLVDLHLEYKKPAIYDTLLEIKTKITKVTNVRIFFEYQITDQAGALYCQGSSINCGVSRDKLKPLAFPDKVLEVLEQSVVK